MSSAGLKACGGKILPFASLLQWFVLTVMSACLMLHLNFSGISFQPLILFMPLSTKVKSSLISSSFFSWRYLDVVIKCHFSVAFWISQTHRSQKLSLTKTVSFKICSSVFLLSSSFHNPLWNIGTRTVYRISV